MRHVLVLLALNLFAKGREPLVWFVSNLFDNYKMKHTCIYNEGCTHRPPMPIFIGLRVDSGIRRNKVDLVETGSSKSYSLYKTSTFQVEDTYELALFAYLD